MAGYIGSKASVVSSGAERKKVFNITGATTSLTGCNYTVGKVQVFQNGVRLLDGTDYTATDGTTVTLTVAAQSGDNVVVLSLASYQVADAVLTSGGTITGDLTVQGAFTSQGIDDNANATAITIDSSENVLVGTTNSSLGTGGIQLNASGRIGASASSLSPMVLNRKTSDGTIIDFRKDGTTVGIVGTVYGDIYVGTGDTGLFFSDANNQIRPYNTSTQNSVDASIDLGRSASRFKDAYLSGGIYLGGTGSANKLDDYETGTWSAGAWSAQANKYVKVGNLVMLTFDVAGPLSGTISQFTLPFTATGTAGTGVYTSSVNFNSGYTEASIVVAGTQGYIRQSGDNVGFLALNIGQGGVVHATLTYNTTA